jgi:hypothetical protein
MNWTEIVKTLGTVLIGSGAGVWLLKSIWSQVLSRDIETFKATLENRNAIEIERLRGELKRVAFEHETRYARLHEKRAEALEELFKRMVRANDAFAIKFRGFVVSGEPSEEEKAKQAAQAADAFLDWFSQNRLFIENDLADRILLVNRQFTNVWLSQGPMTGEERTRRTSEFFKQTPLLLDEIRDKILKILAPKETN